MKDNILFNDGVYERELIKTLYRILVKIFVISKHYIGTRFVATFVKDYNENNAHMIRKVHLIHN